MDGISGDIQPTVIEVTGTHAIEVPGGAFISGAEFVRDNLDLYLIGEDGQTVLLENYFNHETPPDLVSADGAHLSAGLVKSFLPPVHAGEYAESSLIGSDATIASIGTATKVSGNVTVQHADGTVSDMHEGDPIFVGDVITTDAEGAVNIEFIDKTTFAISNDARFAVNDFNYDAEAVEGSSFFSMLRGVFVYTSGLIGKDDPGHVHIETPVGSIGIRGTVVAGHIKPAGEESKISILEGEAFIDNGTGQIFTLNDRLETAVFKGYGSQPVSFGISDIKTLQAEYKGVENVAPALFNTIETGVNPNDYLKDVIRQLKPGHEDSQPPAGDEKSGAVINNAPMQQSAEKQANDPVHTKGDGADAPLPPPPLVSDDVTQPAYNSGDTLVTSGTILPPPPPPPPPAGSGTTTTVFNPPPPPPPSGSGGDTSGGGTVTPPPPPPPNPLPVFDGAAPSGFTTLAHTVGFDAPGNINLGVIHATDNNIVRYSIADIKNAVTNMSMPNLFSIDAITGQLTATAATRDVLVEGDTYSIKIRAFEQGDPSRFVEKDFTISVDPNAQALTGSSGVDTFTGGNITGPAKFVFGYGGDDIFTIGSGTAHELYGGDGNDTFTGFGSVATGYKMYGGAGSDTFYIKDNGAAVIDGGSGIDTVVMGAGGVFPGGVLSIITGGDYKFKNIEQIDLGNAGNSVTLSVADVIGMTDASNTLKIFGGSGSINLAGTGFAYQPAGDGDGFNTGTDTYVATLGGSTVTLIIDNVGDTPVTVVP